MAKFKIIGGKPLHGTISTTGAKNSALPIIAACLLTDEICEIDNIPDILDIQVMLEIIQELGAIVKKINPHKYQIQAQKIKTTQLKSELISKLRASILLMGPMLARMKKIQMKHPGGCIIGKRPVGTHFWALEKMGATTKQDQTYYYAQAPRGLNPTEMFLDEPSVTATENVLMAAALTPGKTVLKDAACEPHVQDLAHFLIKMGALISGIGTNHLEIIGAQKLQGAKHRLIPDFLDIGTFAAAAAATKGEITIKDVVATDLDPILAKLEMMGVKYKLENRSLKILKSPNLKASRIQTRPWPGFPTDLQAPFCVLSTQAKGTSLIHDWIYERRLLYTDNLIKMGAEIVWCDPHRALVTGPTQLYGAQIGSPDIRAGIALIIAGLAAKGETIIDNIDLVDRGYEAVEIRLQALGANIKRIK
ncbi:MAG TPA: UDP-N-acetylglucosamine 1-carboxyvinyltransferase [Patescibacteria group bacterium]|nr:UDP-N-acetylglucosamine 1-carboxyvinyltransferase [Patescibacteria group bacterium]